MSDSKNQRVGADHCGDSGCEPVIVAKANFLCRDGVVFVDHGDGSQLKQLGQRITRVEMPSPLFGIGERQENLRDGQAVARECCLIGMCQADLAGRRGGLFFLRA